MKDFKQADENENKEVTGDEEQVDYHTVTFLLGMTAVCQVDELTSADWSIPD